MYFSTWSASTSRHMWHSQRKHHGQLCGSLSLRSTLPRATQRMARRPLSRWCLPLPQVIASSRLAKFYWNKHKIITNFLFIDLLKPFSKKDWVGVPKMKVIAIFSSYPGVGETFFQNINKILVYINQSARLKIPLLV